MSRIIIGSTNPAKVKAVQAVFTNDEVVPILVESGVSAQPKSDEETLRGAINRAKRAKRYGDIGIGLEGGVAYTAYGLFLCNYGALVDEKGNIYVAGGLRIPLPQEVQLRLAQGLELGDVMDELTKRRGIRHEEGAIGVFTANHVKRADMFEQIIRVLKGQYEFGNVFQEVENDSSRES